MVMCLCMFIGGMRCTPLVEGIKGGRRFMGTLLSPQFRCESKSALQN